MQRSYKLLILSFFLLNLFWWISEVESVYGIPPIIKYILSATVLGIIVFYRFSNPSKPTPGGLFYPVIIVFIIWSIILLIYVCLNIDNVFYIQKIFGQPYFIIPYILPLFLLYTKYDLEFLSDFFHYSSLLIIPAILVQLYIILTGISLDNMNEQIYGITMFDIGSSFLLLTAQLSKKKYIFSIVFFYTILMIFLFAQFGKRGVCIEYMLILSAMIIMRLRSSLLSFNNRIMIYFAGLIMIIMILSFGNLVTSSYVFQRGFNKEAFEASRGDVFRGFFLDFKSTSDLIFGRGIEGKVLRSTLTGDAADFIENGFLILLLKGGVLYLIPFIIILLRASYLGFYKSNNDMVKALASLLLIYFIIMFAYNLPAFDTKYIFIWISISICFTPELRNASNEEITQKFNSRDSI